MRVKPNGRSGRHPCQAGCLSGKPRKGVLLARRQHDGRALSGCRAGGLLAGCAGCGADGERPDAEPAAGDGNSSAGVEFGGDGGEVGDQQGCLLVGVRWSADRSRTTEGRVAPETASSSPKSVSAEMITSAPLAAWARMAWSGAVSRPMSATWIASCPAVRSRPPPWERCWHRRAAARFRLGGREAVRVPGGRQRRIRERPGCQLAPGRDSRREPARRRGRRRAGRGPR